MQSAGPQDPRARADAARDARRVAVRAVCAAIPPGRWASYGDVAEGAGLPNGARLVGRIVAEDPEVENAHRVLRATGRVSEGFHTRDRGGPEVARRLLAAEGVAFGPDGAADPARRWVPPPPRR